MSSALTPEQRALAAKHAGWARSIALARAAVYRRFHDREELIAAAHEGLTKAAAGFDPTRGTSFEAFATKWVVGAVLSVIDGEARHLGRLRQRLVEAADEILGGARSIDDDGTVDGAIDELDRITAELMAEAWLWGGGQELVAQGDAGIVRREALAALDAAIAGLEPPDRRLLELRYIPKVAPEIVEDFILSSAIPHCKLHSAALPLRGEAPRRSDAIRSAPRARTAHGPRAGAPRVPRVPARRRLGRAGAPPPTPARSAR